MPPGCRGTGAFGTEFRGSALRASTFLLPANVYPEPASLSSIEGFGGLSDSPDP